MNKKITNNNPFKTPSSYFDTFEKKLQDKLEKENRVLPKESGFTVPPAYFEGLGERIMAKSREEDKDFRMIKLSPLRRALAIAASFAGIAFFALSMDWSSDNEINFTDLVNAEIEAYFEDTELDLSTDEIAQVISIESYEINDFMLPQMNEENLLDYFIENVDDYDELNLQEND